MACVRNALVVGGGPAGLSAAISMRKVGIDAEVVEVNDEVRSPLGLGLAMVQATLRAVKRLDPLAYEKCLELGAVHRGQVIGDVSGATLEIVEASVADTGLPDGLGIARSAFWGIMADMAARCGTPIRLSTTITDLAQDVDCVEVTFSDGKRKRYDCVIGADGLHSTVRDLVFGALAPSPEHTGLTVWRVVVPRPPELGDYLSMYYGPKLKAGLNPISRDLAYIHFNEDGLREPRPSRDQLPEIACEMLRDFGGVVGTARQSVLAGAEEVRIDCRPLQVLVVPKPWHNGRVLLIGDAAHSTTPQLAMGAALSLEDGILLADALVDARSTDEAFVEFAERRFDRCQLVVESSAEIGVLEKDSSLSIAKVAAFRREMRERLARPVW